MLSSGDCGDGDDGKGVTGGPPAFLPLSHSTRKENSVLVVRWAGPPGMALPPVIDLHLRGFRKQHINGFGAPCLPCAFQTSSGGGGDGGGGGDDDAVESGETAVGGGCFKDDKAARVLNGMPVVKDDKMTHEVG